MASTITVGELLAQRAQPTPPDPPPERVTEAANNAIPPDPADGQKIHQILEAAQTCLKEHDYRNCSHFLIDAFKAFCRHPILFIQFYPIFLDRLRDFQTTLIEHQQFDEMARWICSQEKQGIAKHIVDHFESEELSPSLAARTIELLMEGFRSIARDEMKYLWIKRRYLNRSYSIAKHCALVEQQTIILIELGKLDIQFGQLLPEESCFENGFLSACASFNVASSLDPTHLHYLTEVEKAFIERFSPDVEPLVQGVARILNTSDRQMTQIYLDAAVHTAELLLAYGKKSEAIALYRTLISRAKHKKCSQTTIEVLESRRLALGGIHPPNSLVSTDKNRQILAGIRNLTTFLFHHRIHSLPTPPIFAIPDEFQEVTLKALYECEIVTEPLNTFDNLEEHLAPYTIHQLQRFLGALTIKFSERLYLCASLLLGTPPCKFALLGLGSLARGEMGIHSDLDAVVLVERKDESVDAYFAKVGHLFGLMICNLGETECSINDIKHLHNGFCLDIAALHPAKMIETSERLIALQEQEGRELARGADMDPIRNALRLSCFITGDLDLFASYTTSLHAYFEEGSAELIGSHLLTKLIWPETFQTSFNAKNDLYRPITLFIDALSVRHNIEAYETTARIALLREQNILSPELALLCERALSLACRLRLQSQIHYGEESEEIFLEASPISDGLLLGYEDYQTLREVQCLLFDPLSEMDLRQGISQERLNEGKLHLAQIYVEEQQPQKAQELLAGVAPPKELIIKIALLEGNLEMAASTFRHQDAEGLNIDSRSPYDQALEEHTAWPGPLPDDLDHAPFKRLSSLLHYHRLEIGELNPEIPEIDLDVIRTRIQELSSLGVRTQQQQKDLERAQFILRQQIFIYLRELERNTLSGEMKAFLWQRKEEYLSGARPLPQSYEQLISELFYAYTGREDPTVSAIELLYADILRLLEAVRVAPVHEKTVYQYLYHHLPKSLHPYFLARLEAWGTSPSLIHLLRNFPEPNGYRPMVAEEQEAWIASCRNHPPYRESSPCHLIGVETPHSNLDEGLRKFLIELLKQPPQGAGRHRVGEYQGVYYKISPEFPGRQFAVNLLTKLIAGRGTPPQNLLRITLGNKSYYVLASKEVVGPTLQEVLDNQPELLERLDHKQYCEMVLLSLLINPEDAKPDNFVVKGTEGDGPLRVICIDPDRAFVESMKKRWHGRSSDVQVKNVLYCMDQMSRTFDADFRDEFLVLEPAAILGNWLEQIEAYNARCLDCFGVEAIDQELTKSYKHKAIHKKGCEIPFLIEPTTLNEEHVIQHQGLLLSIYDRFVALQRLLREDPNLSCVDLLKKLEPTLNACYHEYFDSDQSILQRFDRVTIGQYKKIGTASITQTNLKGRYPTLAQYERRGWTCARAWINLNNIIVANKTTKQVAEDLLQRNWSVLNVLKSLNLPEVSDAIFKEIDFSTLTIPFQRELIKQMQGLRFTQLRLAGCQVLSDALLERILRYCPQLTLLDLSNTQGVRDLTCIERHCPRIVKLSLENIPTLRKLSGDGRFNERTIRLDNLLSLNISHCPRLERVAVIAPSLKTLKIRGSHLPNDWQVDFEQLKTLSTTSYRIMQRVLFRYQPCEIHYQDYIIEAIPPPQFEELHNVRAIRSERHVTTFYLGQVEQQLPPALIHVPKSLHAEAFKLSSASERRDSVAIMSKIQPTERELLRLARRNSTLSKLSLLNFNLSNSTLIALAQGCPQLASLDVSACTLLSVLDVSWRKRLSVFNVAWYKPLSRCKQLTDTSIMAVAQGCPQLASLDVSACSNLTDASIIAIAQGCPQLSTLEVSGCKRLTDASLTAVAQGCTQLASLYVSSCSNLTDASLTAIAQGCPQLASLDILRCYRLTDASLTAIARGCTQLASLYVSSCYRLTDASLTAIAQGCPQLTSLYVSCCKKLTDASLTAIAQGCPQLASLDVRLYYNLTDASLTTVAQGCSQLASLNVSKCKKLTDASIIAIAQGCPQLSTLEVSECKRLTDISMVAVAQGCPQLASLDVSYCNNLTDTSMVAVAQGCPQLASLDVSYCNNLTDACKQQIRDEYPHIGLHRSYTDDE